MTESFPIMNGKIQINSGDVSIIDVKIDGKSVESIPEKGAGKFFDNAECDNGAIGSWDRNNWRFLISNLTEKKTKCTLNFTTENTLEEQNATSKIENLLMQENNGETLGTIIEDDNSNVRYIGSNPNNYVFFNCKSEEQNSKNCETWRIIGLMNNIKTTLGKVEKLIKIIREKLPVDLSWDSSSVDAKNKYINDGYGVNEWSQANLMTLLNDDYFNAQTNTNHKCYCSRNKYACDCPKWAEIGLNKTAQDMIEEVVWNTGTKFKLEPEVTNSTPLLYQWERSNYDGKQCTEGNTCNDDVKRQTIWEGKVGLMYPSDYGYATAGGGTKKDREKCLYTPLSIWDNALYTNCPNNDWLFKDSGQWTITPDSSSSSAYSVFEIESDGSVGSYYASLKYSIRPVVYLKSSVKITGGDGTQNLPYTLLLN